MVSGLSQRVQFPIRARKARLAAGGCFGRSDHRGRGKRYRAVRACVAQDSAHTINQSTVELNRPRDMQPGIRL